MQYDLRDIVKLAVDWGVVLPSLEEFWHLGDLTALRQDDLGRFYRSNYERGPLLYTLIAKHRPQTVLEFGTGRGYGTLCMAWAMKEHNIQGRILSIDILSSDTPIDWVIDRHDGCSPSVDRLTWNHVWEFAASKGWLHYIELLNGDSATVMRNYKHPKINFAFIDAGHSLDAVRHDFYTTLQHLDSNFGVLFDDYAEREDFGVKKLIDKEVLPHFDIDFFQTYRHYLNGTTEESIYKMVWADSNTLKQPLAYDYGTQERFIEQYYNQQNPPRWKQRWKQANLITRRLLSRIIRL